MREWASPGETQAQKIFAGRPHALPMCRPLLPLAGPCRAKDGDATPVVA
jgi:hypothetical protein